MTNLFILNETFTNGLNYSVINFISLISILCGIFVIISKNPIVSVLFLIGLFLNIAGYLMMLGMNFIGLSYLLVYVGAVSILFLFILMLINIRISELTSDSSNSIPLAIIIGIFFNMSLYKLLPTNIFTPSVLFIQNKLENMGVSTEGNLANNYYYNTAHTLNKSINLFQNNDLFFVTSQM
jgi:NADH-ubiquinone oxidoreductase chain 6